MEDILTVGYKKGDIDFGISATIMQLTHEQMNEFRVMCMVAIGIAEDMWRREKNKNELANTKQENFQDLFNKPSTIGEPL